MYHEYPVLDIVEQLSADGLLPAILFRTSRKQCDADIEKIAHAMGGRLNRHEQTRLKSEIHAVRQKYGMEESTLTAHPQYGALIQTGVGAHHAGQLLMWRLMLEELMTRGVLKLMIATGTVAAGVDFPARTVVITAHSRRSSEGFNVLSSTEFQQMSGRAGRRGKDSVGFCLVAPSRFSDARLLLDVTRKPAEPLRSAYFASPSSVLNLLKYRNVDDLRFTVEKSLAAFLDRREASRLEEQGHSLGREIEGRSSLKGEALKKALKRVRRMEREAEALRQKQKNSLEETLSGLERLGYVQNGSLSEKGYWAAELCTTFVLELAEAIEAGLFYDLSAFELAGLVASLAGDSHRQYFDLRPNPVNKEYFDKLSSVVDLLQRTYPRAYAADLKVMPDAALTVVTWMESSDWHEFAGLLRLARVAEGDVARLVTQTADHLNQLCKLYKSHPELSRTAAEARRQLMKPPLSEGFLGE